MGLVLGILGIITFIALFATLFGVPYFFFLSYKEKINGKTMSQ